MKPNRGKCTNKRQLSTKQPSRWAQKGNRIRKNNDSSHILINIIVHLNYKFNTCYPTKLYGLRGNWRWTLECLQNKTLT